MTGPRRLALAFLSRDLAGLWTAGTFLAVGIAAALLGDGTVQIVAMAVAVLGVLLLSGTLRHLIALRKARGRNPPPGVLVKVGGHRLHVLAEGSAAGRPPVVWMPGGHAGGWALHHLHRALREETRSILIDRPGTGWSDAGPFPRTTDREAREVLEALEAAGEKGPFVLAGHSFGGLLFAALARRRPGSVAALLLLDATPPDTITYGPPVPGLARMKWRPVFAGVLQLFGLDALADRLSKGPPSPEYERLDRLIRERLGEVWHNARALERGPRAACASASIFDELTPRGMASIAWTTLPYEGDLDGIPLLLVAPGDMQDLEQVAEMIDDEAPTPGQLDAARLQRFYQRSRERYLNLSDLSERVTAPPGTAHNFPYEAPDFVIEVVRQTLHRLAAGPPWKAQP